MEAFISIHMSLFVLIPFSKIISSENYKKVFVILFLIRAVILLYFDFCITTNIAIIDFIAVFIGAFTISFFYSKIAKKGNNDSISKAVPTENIETKTIAEKDDSPVVLIDKKYLNNEAQLIRDAVKGEIESQGEDAYKLTTNEINKKKNIIILLFGLLTFIYSIMYFFNIDLFTCLICEIVTALIYRFLIRKLNIVNVIARIAKKNPNEDISQIVAKAKENKKQAEFPVFLKTLMLVIVAVLIPIFMFSTPRIIYFNYGSGYAVVKYTRSSNGTTEDIVIPDTYKGKNVIAIGEGAFANTNIKTITLPQNLESIKYKAFYNCTSLESIVIPESVTEIRASAFENCTKLKKVSLSNGITKIRASAFKNDKKLYDIELPESLEYLGASAFSHCSSLREITIPSKVTEINGQTFEYCTLLKKINLHDNIVSIHGETFVGDEMLNDVTLPSKITEIRGNTFEGCTSLTSIVIPDGVTRIGGHAFYGCGKLSYVYVPSTVVEIGSSAFRQCTSLKSISLPRKAVINERAFKESPTTIIYY
jgi:hypothetical protein